MNSAWLNYLHPSNQFLLSDFIHSLYCLQVVAILTCTFWCSDVWPPFLWVLFIRWAVFVWSNWYHYSIWLWISLSINLQFTSALMPRFLCHSTSRHQCVEISIGLIPWGFRFIYRFESRRLYHGSFFRVPYIVTLSIIFIPEYINLRIGFINESSVCQPSVDISSGLIPSRSYLQFQRIQICQPL